MIAKSIFHEYLKFSVYFYMESLLNNRFGQVYDSVINRLDQILPVIVLFGQIYSFKLI